MRGARVSCAMALSLVVGAACTSESPISLPTPGPSSMFLRPTDATFVLAGRVEIGGIRHDGQMHTLDQAGYPSKWGTIMLEEVSELATSAACPAPKRADPDIVFGPRWPHRDRLPDPAGAPYVPTRFAVPPGTTLQDALEGKTIRVWGTVPFPGCPQFVAQYVEVIP